MKIDYFVQFINVSRENPRITCILCLFSLQPFSAGTDFRRQNLTSKVDHRTQSKTFIVQRVIHMKNELTKTFMKISN